MKYDLYLGVKASVKKTFLPEEVDYYCRNISQDTNPIHLDSQFAKSTPFGKCIVPGLMAASLFSGILGTSLPGNGTIHLSQTCKFMLPLFVGDAIEAEIELIYIREDKPIYTFRTSIYNTDAKVVAIGEAVVKYVPT